MDETPKQKQNSESLSVLSSLLHRHRRSIQRLAQVRVGIGFLVGASCRPHRVCCLGIQAQPMTRLPDAVVVFAEDAGRGHAETDGESDGEEECFGAGLHAGAPVVLELAGGKGVRGSEREA